MEHKQKHREGEALIEVIRQRAHDQNLEVREIAEKIGVSYVYMTSLLSGGRRFSGLDDDKKRVLAKFLEISMVQLLVLCDSLRPEDFAVEQDLDDRLLLSFHKLALDPVYGVTVPSPQEWNQMPQSARLMMALLYEQVANEEIVRKVLPYKLTE